ncbi:TnpV protein [[Clostridium] innocuum]
MRTDILSVRILLTSQISIRLPPLMPSASPQATFPRWRCGKSLRQSEMCKSKLEVRTAHLQEISQASMIKAGNNPKGANTMSEITYTKQGDYLIPDLTLPTEPELPLGRYALMHRDYLENHKRVTYLNLLTSGRLNAHLHQTEQTALQRLELLTKQLAKEQGVTEELKEKAPMQWVQAMNAIRSQAEEAILNELIYN